jgi:hypothetical protein
MIRENNGIAETILKAEELERQTNSWRELKGEQLLARNQIINPQQKTRMRTSYPIK